MATFFPLHAGDANKITDGTDTLLINSDGSIPTTQAISQTQTITAVSFSNQTGSGDVATVGAGKKWIIYALQHSTAEIAGNTRSGYTQILFNAVVVSQQQVSVLTAGGPSSAVSHFMDFSAMPMTLSAGQKITQTRNTAGAHSGTIFYLEVNA